MGLKDGDHPTLVTASSVLAGTSCHHTAGCGENRGDLGRVVRVIVVYRDARSTPLVFEAASDTTECLDSRDDLGQFTASAYRAEDRAEAVACHVDSRCRESDRDLDGGVGDRLCEPHIGHPATPLRRPREQRGRRDDVRDGDRVGVGAVPEHPDTARGQLGGASLRECHGSRIVEADDERAARPDLIGELVEHRDICFDAAEEVQMVDFDVGDHHDVGGVFEERPVALVGLRDEYVAATVMGVGARLVEFAADRERRIEARVLQRDDGHRRRRRLAVCSGDEQRAVVGHQSCEDVGPQQNRDPTLACRDEFRIGLGYCGVRRDDDGRTAGQHIQGGGVVTDRDLGAARTQRDDSATCLGVRSRHLTTTGQQNPRKPRHSCPADTDHVDSTKLVR